MCVFSYACTHKTYYLYCKGERCDRAPLFFFLLFLARCVDGSLWSHPFSRQIAKQYSNFREQGLERELTDSELEGSAFTSIGIVDVLL